MRSSHSASSPVDGARLKGIYKSLDECRRALNEPPAADSAELQAQADKMSTIQTNAKRLLAAARDDGTLRRLTQNGELSITNDQKLGELERILGNQASMFLGVLSQVIDSVLSRRVVADPQRSSPA